tara:strand:+ start:991 stop:1293 length:303 start_codon:yes stop_codon:yes gene_type:complete
MTYGHAKPNFCTKCGQQLNKSVSVNTAGAESTVQKSVVLSDNETDAESVPEISSLQVEIQNEKNITTFGSLVGEEQSEKGERSTRSRSINEFIDEKKKER